jgi:hypothetical protein
MTVAGFQRVAVADDAIVELIGGNQNWPLVVGTQREVEGERASGEDREPHRGIVRG